jgi:hypothetical protein
MTTRQDDENISPLMSGTNVVGPSAQILTQRVQSLIIGDSGEPSGPITREYDRSPEVTRNTINNTFIPQGIEDPPKKSKDKDVSFGTHSVCTYDEDQPAASINERDGPSRRLKGFCRRATDRVRIGPGLAEDEPIGNQSAISTETNKIAAEDGAQLLEHQVTAKSVPVKIKKTRLKWATEQMTYHSKSQDVRPTRNQDVAASDGEGIRRAPRRNMLKISIRNMLRSLKPKIFRRR